MWCRLVVFIGDGKTMFCSIVLDVACERPTFSLIWSFCKFSTLQSLKYSQVSSKVSWALGIMNKVIMLWYSRIKMSFKVITTMSLLAFTWTWKAYSFVLPIQSKFWTKWPSCWISMQMCQGALLEHFHHFNVGCLKWWHGMLAFVGIDLCVLFNISPQQGTSRNNN